MSGLHHVYVTETVGKVTIQIRGKSSCSVSELSRFALLLSEIMNDLAFEGEYTVRPRRYALPGSASQKGVSVDGTQYNVVGIGFQPSGNASRARYDLHISNAQEVFVKLKDYVGTAYDGKPKSKPAYVCELPAVEDDSESPAITDTEVVQFAKPTEKPDIYYTANPDWVRNLVEEMWFLADVQSDRHLTKTQILKLIFERTHFDRLFLVGPIFKTLKDRGYLVEVEGKSDTFVVNDAPNPAVKRSRKPEKLKVPKLPVPKIQSEVKRGSYLTDEEWVRSFMEELRELVANNKGLISQTDLNRLIVRRANQKKIAGVVYKICSGLKLRGLIITAGEKLYRVVYEPRPDTVQSALADIMRTRAESAKTFEGFAKFKLPSFAEGMFDNKKLLDEFLQKVAEGFNLRSQLQAAIGYWYPGLSGQSYLNLLNYMVGQGYLIRQKLGQYALGPTGLERLGIHRSENTPVRTVVAPTSEETLQAILPVEPPESAVIIEASPVPSNTPAPIGAGVIEATAHALAKASAYKAEADASELEEAKLRARLDELKRQLAKGPSPEVVEAAVMEKLVAMANEL